MTKQINKTLEQDDIVTFFQESNITQYLENCYKITLTKKDISYSNMSYWEANGFSLVGIEVTNGNLVITVNLNKRRLMRGIVKEVLVVQ